MKKFEYKIFFIPELSDLNRFGEQGWELVCVRGDEYFYFKREITDKTNNTIC